MLLPLEGYYMLTVGLMALGCIVVFLLTETRIRWKLRRRKQLLNHMRWLQELGLFETRRFYEQQLFTGYKNKTL